MELNPTYSLAALQSCCSSLFTTAESSLPMSVAEKRRIWESWRRPKGRFEEPRVFGHKRGIPMSRSGNTPRRGARQVCPLGVILWSKSTVSSVPQWTSTSFIRVSLLGYTCAATFMHSGIMLQKDRLYEIGR